MKDYNIITDVTSDLFYDITKDYNIAIAPLKYSFGDKSYTCFIEKDTNAIKEFYKILRSGKRAKTTQVSHEDFIKLVEPMVLEGKDIIYLSFSSVLSGTYQAVNFAVSDLREKYPDTKFIVIDTKCASLGQGLFVYLAAQKKKEGLNIDELADWVENNKLKLCHWFWVDDLHYLKKGGRVSATTAVIGTALGIKPILHVDNEGRLISVDKARGNHRVVDKVINRMKETAIDVKNQTIFIGHGDNIETAELLAARIKKELKVKDVRIGYIGPIIGAHSGPGTIALFFLGTER